MKEILCTLVPAALAAMLFTGCGGAAPREEVESTSGMETEASSALPESTAGPAEDYMAAAGSFKVSDVYAPDTQGEASPSSDSALPHFTYPDDDPVPNAICDYLTTVIAAQYETAEVSIPQISIIEVDESKDDDIKVWGDFWIYNYNLEGETLMTLSGGNYPGLMHLKKNPDGSCSVTSFDQVEDGSNFDSSAKKIFGDKYDRLQEIMSDDKSRDGFRTAMIKNYVEDNGLGVTQYQDYGMDPVSLK